MAKRLGSRYEPGQRSGAWQKMRVNRGQEFVIAGNTSSPKNFDAIIFGYYDGPKLIYDLGDYELDYFAVLATTTALRQGSLLPRKWADVHNLDGDLPFIMEPITKNGEPKAALLSDEAVETLKKLPS